MPVLIILGGSVLHSAEDCRGWSGTGMDTFHLRFSSSSNEMCPVGSRCPLGPQGDRLRTCDLRSLNVDMPAVRSLQLLLPGPQEVPGDLGC